MDKQGKKEMNRGDREAHTFVCTNKKGERKEIGLIIWMDSKPVYLLTTDSDCSVIETCKRRSKREGGVIEIKRPLPVGDYNKHMGGVDMADMKRLYCETRVHGLHRWWVRLFFYYIDVTASNALILLKESDATVASKWNLKDFKMDWVSNKIGVNLDKKNESLKSKEDHQYSCYLEHSSERKRCGWCKLNLIIDHDHKSNFICVGCRTNYGYVHYCLTSSRNCWKYAHISEGIRKAFLQNWDESQRKAGCEIAKDTRQKK